MGEAVAHDLAKNELVKEIRLADINFNRAKKVSKKIGSSVINPVKVNVQKPNQLFAALEGVDTTIGCISYKYNYELAKAAIQAGVNFCDLGGNNAIVKKEFSLDEQAREANVTIVPDCGLAPGLVNILVAAGAQQLDKIEEVHIRVGGLPQNPQPPLNYTLLFSAEGLLNEYIEPAEIIREEERIQIPSLSELEEIKFREPFGILEAFQTSGGASTLPKTFEGKVNELDYKTIRYPGHCQKIKTILDFGFRSTEEISFGKFSITPREFLEKMMEKILVKKEVKDVTLLRTEIIGFRKEKKQRITYEIIDFYDEESGLTSMMRMTAFPTSIIAQMITNGSIEKKGVIVQEFNIPGKKMRKELQKRNITIQEKIESI